MKLTNHTRLAAAAFRQFDAEGGLDCVVAASGTFVHRQDDEPGFASDQEGFHWEDVYEGDPHRTIQLRQSDLVPEKPGTDVTFLGEAHAPEGRLTPTWECSIRVGDRVEKRLRIHGRRFWVPQFHQEKKRLFGREKEPLFSGWALTEAEPATSVPVSWALAYGGSLPREGDESADVHRHNPLGCGIPPRRSESLDEETPAPQIEAPDDPIRAWDRDYRPEGFGPISPWWRPRQQYTGTYDDRWLETRHPLLPRDFDARFWQSAHPDLVATPPLAGGETYELVHLHPRYRIARGRLPDARLGVHCLIHESRDGPGRDEWFLLHLDGVHFDFRGSDERMTLTWRVRFPMPDAAGADLTLRRVTLLAAEADAQDAAMSDRATEAVE